MPNPPQVGVPVYGVPLQGFPPIHSAPANPWRTGLCESSDLALCCITCWFPCITFGRIAEVVDRGQSSCMCYAVKYQLVDSCTGCACLYSGHFRSKLRQHFGLIESPCNDCCVHWCCHKCALRQEYRELKLRGYDPALGWAGNMDRYNSGAQMATSAPISEGGIGMQRK